MTLKEEDELVGFLGIHIEHTSDHAKLTQKGLTQHTVDALEISDLPPVSAPVDNVMVCGWILDWGFNCWWSSTCAQVSTHQLGCDTFSLSIS